MFFNTACSASNFVCWFITRPSPVGCVGGVGCVGCVGWQGQKLSQCRDTVFNLAEGTIEGKVLSMYSWVPSAPPARRRTEWGSSSLPCPPLRGQGVCWQRRRKRVLTEELGGERAGWERTAHRWRSAPPRTRGTWQGEGDLKGSARARQKLGEGGKTRVDWLTHTSPPPPAPPRVRFAEFRLVFLVSNGQEERSMSIFIPAPHRSPPLPTSHRPSTTQHSRRPVHRVAHAPSRASSKHAKGRPPWSQLGTLKLAENSSSHRSPPRLRRSCPRSEATCTRTSSASVGRELARGGRCR